MKDYTGTLKTPTGMKDSASKTNNLVLQIITNFVGYKKKDLQRFSSYRYRHVLSADNWQHIEPA
jgi:hypothetical protein